MLATSIKANNIHIFQTALLHENLLLTIGTFSKQIPHVVQQCQVEQ